MPRHIGILGLNLTMNKINILKSFTFKVRYLFHIIKMQKAKYRNKSNASENA